MTEIYHMNSVPLKQMGRKLYLFACNITSKNIQELIKLSIGCLKHINKNLIHQNVHVYKSVTKLRYLILPAFTAEYNHEIAILTSAILSVFRSPDGSKPINQECSLPDAASGSFREKLRSFRTPIRAWITTDLKRCEQSTIMIK